jgi:hypothetical protein
MNRLLSKLSLLLGRIRGSGLVKRPGTHIRPRLEALEDRLSPSTLAGLDFPHNPGAPCSGPGLYFPHNPG